ncbi:hypothetical protein EK904_007477, partial [Melospiza melodia maxima]
KEPLEEAEPWAHGEKLIAARRDSSRSRGAAATPAAHSAAFQHTTDLDFPVGAGWCEPWASGGCSWKADSAVFLLRLRNTATAAISINLSSCFTFWPLREIFPRDSSLKDKFIKHFTGPVTFSSECSKHFHRLYHNTRDCSTPT